MRRILDGQKLIIGESEYQLLPDDNDKELMDVPSGSGAINLDGRECRG